ncbi:MAG TPA: hypothetical protein VF666_17130 [Pyrinomonadaceae bacterium]|jgi:hypothetical protein
MMLRKQLSSVAALVLLLSCILCAAPTSAQTPTTTPTPTNTPETNTATDPPVASQTSPVEPDISITATVTARELLFDVVPNPTVEFNGRPRRETVWEADRQNLPRPVRPGETYRDIGIRLRITSVFADIERIVTEALGEVPVNDNNATPPPQQTTPPPPPPTTTTTPAAANLTRRRETPR